MPDPRKAELEGRRLLCNQYPEIFDAFAANRQSGEGMGKMQWDQGLGIFEQIQPKMGLT